MTNLFSVFDPITPIFGFIIPLNWLASISVRLIIIPRYWKILGKLPKFFSNLRLILEKEIAINLGVLPTPGLSHLVVSLFLMVAANNYLGLTPYTFTSSSHLTFTIRLALTFWLGLILIRSVYTLRNTLAHLVPLGTPYALIPLMVLIEIISNLIRPLTLSVRLAANIVAGHLLLTLISGALVRNHWLIIGVGIGGLSLLIVLENAVAIIQGYVFSILPSLYLAEVNSVELNYLNNKFLKFYNNDFVLWF